MKKCILHTAICLLTFCTFGFLNSYCQNSLITNGTLRIQRTFQKETQLPSEKAWQPIQYTEPDVDKKTGAIGYSIPLCQLTCGSLSLPISLQYHGNGIKADDDACTVGLGWNLSAGGYITRTICGRPDEQNFAGVKKASTVINSQDLSYVKDVLHRQKDANYDRYNYSFCGYSGSFIISSGGAITQLPATDLRIEAYGSMSAGFDSFKITTPDGNIYWFNEQEHTNYIYHSTTLETRVGYNTPDYTAVTGWYLTQITSPQQNDTIYFEYQHEQITRQRIQDRLNNLSTYMIGIETITSSTPPNQLRDESVITHPDKCLPLSIRCRGTRVNFTNSQFLNTPYYTITQIKLYSDSIGNDANNEVKRISLAYSQTGDNRSLLQSCEMHSKNTLVDKRTFTYYTGVTNDHTDLFGYKNHNTQAPALSSSVLDTDGLLCANKQHYFASAVGYMLKTVKDANGALATIEYEPSQCRSGNRDIHVGIRVKKITSSENLTKRNIVRKFEYANAASTIDFAWVTHDAFITPGGMLGGPTLSTPKYTCGATFTSSSRIPGAQVENCEIYYGRVAEKVIGTGLPDTLCTVYEYDLSDIQHPFISNGCQSVLPNLDNRADAERYLGTKIISNRSYEEEMRIFSPHHITGHFRENCREKAPLKRKILMRKTHDGYKPEYEEENFYSYVESSVLDVGFHVELITRNYNCEAAGSVQTVEQDDYLSDFNFMETTLQSARLFKDSTVIRRYYPDGNVRMTSIGYYYNSRSSGRLPFLSSAVLPPIVPIRLGLMGFSGDSIRLSNMGMLQAIKVKCGNSTFDRYFCYADNVESATYNSIKSKGMRTLPVMEKIVVDGKDSLLTCYSYKSFGNSHNIQLSEQRILHGDAEVASQQFLNYDQWGNVLATSVNHGMVTSYQWDHEYGLPTGFYDGGMMPSNTDLNDIDSLMITTCTYLPMIGCSSMTMPNGKAMNFGYEGSRLNNISEGGEVLKSYTYRLNADNTNQCTMVEESIHTGSNTPNLVTQTYFDGFGYPVNVKQKNTDIYNNDLVVLTQYDALHRPTTTWLPTAKSGAYDLLTAGSSITTTARTNYGDDRPYSTKTYEPVPYEQLSADIPEGTAFWEHPVTYAHLCTNNSDSNLKCRRFVLCDNEGVKTDGYYGDGELDVLQTTDNDGNVTYVFTDYRGNKILERSINGFETPYDTYYVYDALGNLRYVLPPGISHNLMASVHYISTSTTLKNFAYYYRYDDKLRLVEKKLPGNAPIYFVNDLTGTPILTQDGNLRQSGKWQLTLPDKFSREVLDCIVSCTDNEKERIQNTWAHANTPNFLSTQSTLCQTGYTANISVSNPKLLNATYYDTYGCLGLSSFANHLPQEGLQTTDANAKGLKTATLSAVGDDGVMASVVRYDNHDRPYKVFSSNIMGGYDITQHEYTLDGRPTIITHRHATQFSTPSNSAICETLTYGYDNAGRQTSLTHNYNNGEDVVLQQNTYDLAGRLATTRVNDINRLQTTYEYNIRGWLKTLNNPLFYESLKYDEVQNESTPQYGGNISFMNWKVNTVADSDPMHGFVFKYDNLSRLKSAHYFRDDVSKTWYQTTYTYNKMGNIASLIRRCTTNNSTTKLLDNLKYTYSGNRLTRVKDSATGVTNVDYQQFYDGASEATEYLYDQNGNMTEDKNSGITRVGYDANNQPDSVTFSTGESIRYYYDGMGNRLGTDEYTAFMPVYLQGAANTLTNDDDREVQRRRYCGNFIYEDGTLQRVLVEGGFITFSNGTPQYHFYIKDHLGSNRVVTDANGNIEEYNHYYPYGALMNISSASTQPYKYNGKELNRLNRLLWYDQSARQYNPILGRFMSMDPLCEKYYSISPYAFCANNPVKYVDPDGRDPGDFFETQDEAAIDFGMIYNPLSIYYNREYGASIYLVVNSNGDMGYSYTVPFKGEEDHTSFSLQPIFPYKVAFVHAHGSTSTNYDDNNFSPEDKSISDKSGCDMYLAAPNGTLQKYNPEQKSSLQISDMLPKAEKNNSISINNYPSSLKCDKLHNKFAMNMKIIFNAIHTRSYANYNSLFKKE